MHGVCMWLMVMAAKMIAAMMIAAMLMATMVARDSGDDDDGRGLW